MIYKMIEWQSGNGNWCCNCVDNFAGGSGEWYLPARVLKISPAEFITLLLSKYKPDHFHFNKEKCFCHWSWSSQTAMRRFKNDINAAARKNNFVI